MIANIAVIIITGTHKPMMVSNLTYDETFFSLERAQKVHFSKEKNS